MTRTFATVIVLVLILAAFLVIRYAKDSYKILPVDKGVQKEAPMTNHQAWHEYSSPDGSYKVLFPTDPQHVSERTTDPKTKISQKYDTYVAQNPDGTIYMIATITYPERIDANAAAEDLLSNVLNEMMSPKTENHLKSSKKGLFHGHKALDFTLENDAFEYEVKAFVDGKTLYVLSSITKRGEENRKNFDFFVNSFSLAKDKNDTSAK